MRPEFSVAGVLDRVRTRGFALLAEPLDDAAFVAFARALGPIVDDTPVRLIAGKRTYLASPDPIPMHTDHPMADLVAWRCEAQDAQDGASLLVDGFEVLRDLEPDHSEALAQIELPAMVRLGDEALPTPILSQRNDRMHFFFAPWLDPIGRPTEGTAALRKLRQAIDRRLEDAAAVRLEPGQVLLVDNHRVMHGRGRLLVDSARRLRRLWVRAPRPTLSG